MGKNGKCLKLWSLVVDHPTTAEMAKISNKKTQNNKNNIKKTAYSQWTFPASASAE
jgi:hypothetical protein